MIFLDELKSMYIYKKQFHLPINEKNKKKGSVITLITPNIQSSINTINHPLFLNKYHHGYYIEKDINYFISRENITESGVMTYEKVTLDDVFKDINVLEEFEDIDETALNEAMNYKAELRKILYNNRFRRPNEVFPIYEQIEEGCKEINETYLRLKRYKGFNLFNDFYYYNEIFFKNNNFENDKGINLYFEFLTRFINDKRLDKNGYSKKTVFIPVNDWAEAIGSNKIHMYNQTINPISVIYRILKTKNLEKIKEHWGDLTFVFLGKSGYFQINFMDFNPKQLPKFLSFINQLSDPGFEPKEDNDIDQKESRKSKVLRTVEFIEKGQRVKINNLTGEGETSQDKLVKKIDDTVVKSAADDPKKIIDDTTDYDLEARRLVKDVVANSNNTVKLTNARSKRMNQLSQGFNSIDTGKGKVSDFIDNKYSELPSTSLQLDTINDEWNNLKYINFDSEYRVESDILSALHSLGTADKKYPLGIIDISIDDTSTPEDFVDTYTVKLEDVEGKRYTVKLDIPQFVDNKYMMLKGNKKSMNSQIVTLPVNKINPTTVHVVTDYNKITIERFGNKSYEVSDLLLKKVKKVIDSGSTSIKYQTGDASAKNNKYDVPIDYSELSEEYTKLETKDHIIYLNQDEIRSKYDIEEERGLPIGYNKKRKEVVYASLMGPVSQQISDMIFFSIPPADQKIFENTKNKAKKYAYSRASVLNKNIPLIVVLSYSEGLLKVMNKANIHYEITEKRPKSDYGRDIIKFSDGYISYDIDYNSSMLMNGIKECNTSEYSIADLDSKTIYLDWLDIFGGRILADGIDNFYELMIYPAVEEILIDYDLPTDYVELMIYASNLLTDTGFTPHIEMTSRRIRSNEILAAITYKALSKAYGDYKRSMRVGRKNAKFSIDQQAVVKNVLEQNIIADASILNAVLEAETLSAVSYKGPTGLNTERAYGLDKRGYDKSMQNVLAMSTINSANTGINRQLTIDANIDGKRGYIKTIDDPEELNVTKAFTFSEALTPFGPNRDDPPRTAMTYTQTKHGMRVKKSSPLLVSNGADQALPYFISNTFAVKAKGPGEVIERTDDLILIKYDNGKKEFIDLRTSIQKNSSSGFYINIDLVSDIKKGAKLKKDQIIAHDPQSFSSEVGTTNNLSYNIGTFVKIAMMNSDDGFEDSAIISEKLSGEMASDVIIKRDVPLGKSASIYNMVKPGEEIQEGDPLLYIQDSFDEEDVNILMRNLTDDQDVITDLGRKAIKSKVTGTVEAIKVYRTCDLSDMSPTLKKTVRDLEKHTKEIKAIMKEYDMESAEKFLEPTEKLEPTGRLKNIDEGVLLEFYLKYEDKMSIGDKLTFFVALKGIVRDIFPDGDEPYTDFRPNEPIDAVLALGSTQSRMTFSIKIHMLINKILVELSRSVRDIVGIKSEY